MTRAVNTIFAAVILVLSFAAPVVANPLDDAVAAANRGDNPTALRLLRPLADQGCAAAQVFLGQMYGHGLGVPQDYAEALKWYRKAADQGDATGQYMLGFIFLNGLGVPQDYVSAHMWWNLSGAFGNPYSAKHRDDVARLMTSAQIAEAQKLAREWKPTTQPPRPFCEK
jgi:TPR repeat protein